MPKTVVPHGTAKTRRVLIGINGGHHQSTAWGYDSFSSNPIGVRGLPLNFHNSIPEHVSRLRLDRLLNSLSDALRITSKELRDATEHLVIALPGAISFRKNSDEKCYDALGEYLMAFGNWEVVDDTWAGLYAATGSTHGVCGYASAGSSVCIAQGEFSFEKKFKIDGWGPIIGDHGSAFDITRDYFRQLGRRLDSNCVNKDLFKVVKQFINTRNVVLYDNNLPLPLPKLNEVEETQEWFDDLVSFGADGQWRSMFAEIARPILEFVDSNFGSENESELVTDNALKFSESILIALEKSYGPVVLQGGLIRNSKLYRDTVIKKISDEDGSREVIISTAKPAVGALMLAVDGLHENGGVWSFEKTNSANSLQLRDRILTRHI